RNLTEGNTAAAISSSGTLTINDIDSPATFVTQAGTVGTYGAFAIGANGAWTYTASSAHNEFVAGTTYTDTFAVTSADGTATSVKINILGTNDASVLTTLINTSPDCGDAMQGQTMSDSGSFTDSDATDTHSVTIKWGDDKPDT